jgi:hypothetical protein
MQTHTHTHIHTHTHTQDTHTHTETDTEHPQTRTYLPLTLLVNVERHEIMQANTPLRVHQAVAERRITRGVTVGVHAVGRHRPVGWAGLDATLRVC